MAHRTKRCPSRSPAMPNSGAASVPKYCSEPNRVSSSTEPVSARMYQPRISVSISLPQEVSRSAGYWNRKLRMRNGASSEDDIIAGNGIAERRRQGNCGGAYGQRKRGAYNRVTPEGTPEHEHHHPSDPSGLRRRGLRYRHF